MQHVIQGETGNVTTAAIPLSEGLLGLHCAINQNGSGATAAIEISPNDGATWIEIASNIGGANSYWPTASTFVRRFGGTHARVVLTGATGPAVDVWFGAAP